mmetsp:Transcript_28332/g.92355  ORF Transcript_28332/g.92355 Transcript_28332/m.92355 type:complete len:305 (+) Transcript_28332:251-1165(+)
MVPLCGGVGPTAASSARAGRRDARRRLRQKHGARGVGRGARPPAARPLPPPHRRGQRASRLLADDALHALPRDHLHASGRRLVLGVRERLPSPPLPRPLRAAPFAPRRRVGRRLAAAGAGAAARRRRPLFVAAAGASQGADAAVAHPLHPPLPLRNAERADSPSAGHGAAAGPLLQAQSILRAQSRLVRQRHRRRRCAHRSEEAPHTGLHRPRAAAGGSEGSRRRRRTDGRQDFRRSVCRRRRFLSLPLLPPDPARRFGELGRQRAARAHAASEAGRGRRLRVAQLARRRRSQVRGACGVGGEL